MSKGELGSQPDPTGELEFDSPSLTAVVGPELSAVHDAQGDLKGAQMRMAEQVKASQREVLVAEGNLTDRQQAVIARVEKLRLLGRKINIHEGMSAGEIRSTPSVKGEKTHKLSKLKDLAGVKGIIVGSEVEGKTDEEVASDSLLLHVAVSGSLIPPRAFRRYLVRADETVFSIGKAPGHADY